MKLNTILEQQEGIDLSNLKATDVAAIKSTLEGQQIPFNIISNKLLVDKKDFEVVIGLIDRLNLEEGQQAIVDKNGVVWRSPTRKESQKLARAYALQLPDDTHDGGTQAEFNKWWKENTQFTINSPAYKEVILLMNHEYSLPIQK